MARTYRRDARGRFAGGGYSGQTGGRGARLKSAGNTRKGGGAKISAAGPMRSGTIAKGGNGVRGSVARSLAAVNRGQAAPAVKPASKERTVYRTRDQAIKAQQGRTNALGKATAVSRGFNEAARKRESFADSAPRTVISRPRVPQMTLSGRVERVGAGRFRQVGERMGGGSIRRTRSKRGPIKGSKSYRRELDRMIKGNGGRDAAAFRFS